MNLQLSNIKSALFLLLKCLLSIPFTILKRDNIRSEDTSPALDAAVGANLLPAATSTINHKYTNNFPERFFPGVISDIAILKRISFRRICYCLHESYAAPSRRVFLIYCSFP